MCALYPKPWDGVAVGGSLKQKCEFEKKIKSKVIPDEPAKF